MRNFDDSVDTEPNFPTDVLTRQEIDRRTCSIRPRPSQVACPFHLRDLRARLRAVLIGFFELSLALPPMLPFPSSRSLPFIADWRAGSLPPLRIWVCHSVPFLYLSSRLPIDRVRSSITDNLFVWTWTCLRLDLSMLS